jgi:hypothetical protein
LTTSSEQGRHQKLGCWPKKKENKKARIAILELPDADDEPGSGNHIVETDTSQ